MSALHICRLITFAATFCLLVASASSIASKYRLPGGAASLSDPYIAAGYRALFTCSAHFLMSRPLQDILLVELADTAVLKLPDPEIDAELGLVRAADGLGNKLIAAYRDTMGCTLLPPDWREADIPRLPYVQRPQAPDMQNVPYPRGDAADPRPNETQQAVLDKTFDASAYGEGTLTTDYSAHPRGGISGYRRSAWFGIGRDGLQTLCSHQ